VEVAFPALDPALQAEIREILEVQLADAVKGRVLGADGGSHRPSAAGGSLGSQDRLLEIVARRSRSWEPSSER